jgi:hypothetical protein
MGPGGFIILSWILFHLIWEVSQNKVSMRKAELWFCPASEWLFWSNTCGAIVLFFFWAVLNQKVQCERGSSKTGQVAKHIWRSQPLCWEGWDNMLPGLGVERKRTFTLAWLQLIPIIALDSRTSGTQWYLVHSPERDSSEQNLEQPRWMISCLLPVNTMGSLLGSFSQI